MGHELRESRGRSGSEFSFCSLACLTHEPAWKGRCPEHRTAAIGGSAARGQLCLRVMRFARRVKLLQGAATASERKGDEVGAPGRGWGGVEIGVEPSLEGDPGGWEGGWVSERYWWDGGG